MIACIVDHITSLHKTLISGVSNTMSQILNVNKEHLHKELEELTKSILHQALQMGASDACISVAQGIGLDINARSETIENISFSQGQSCSIQIFKGKSKGTSQTSDFSKEAIYNALKMAYNIANFTQKDEHAGLAEASSMAKDFPDLDLFHPWEVSIEKLKEDALACERAAKEYHNKIKQIETASLGYYQTYSVLANTRDFIGHNLTSKYDISCSAIAQENESMERDYWFTVARNPKDLESPQAVGERAAKRTIRRLNSKPITTEKLPIIFAPETATSLISHFLSAINGHTLYKKASFLLDKINTPVFPTDISIFEQPLLPRGFGSASFDADGLATRNNKFIQEGILSSYILDTYSARRLKMESSANAGGTHNLTVNSSSACDQESLIEGISKGILVTELMGQGVNLITGDYSRGASGFLIENGKITHPINQITIAGNLAEMFKSIIGVGTDLEKRGNIITGSLLIERMTVSGN